MDAAETAVPTIRTILMLSALSVLCLTLVGPSGARTGEEAPPDAATCAEVARAESGEEACGSLQISLAASPNPTPAGGTVSFSWSVSPATDCWDNLGNGAWGGYSFSRAVSEPFTWVVYCTGSGVESASLYVGVDGSGGSDPPPPPPPPSGDHDPKGHLDVVDAGSAAAYGWTCDPDAYGAALDVRFYVDGAPGVGTFLGTATAGQTREPAVGDLCGGARDHGFAFPLPASVRDGRSHSLYAYAVNIGEGSNFQLIGSPKSFQTGTPPPDADGDGIADDTDNCPSYYSTDNKCDSEPASADEESGALSAWALSGSGTCNARWYARVERNVFGQVLWRYRLDIEWCWQRSKITEVSVRVTPELHAICCWFWRGTAVYDVGGTANDTTYYANWGKTSFGVYSKGIFEWVFPARVGFGVQYLPYIRFSAYAGGSYSQSGGG